MKFKKIIFIGFTLFLFSRCGSSKDSETNDKKITDVTELTTENVDLVSETSEETSSTETAAVVNKTYEYDTLQQVFLAITEDMTQDDIMNLIESNNLCYSKHESTMINRISYKIAYEQGVTMFSHADKGDYVYINFCLDTGVLLYAKYFNTKADYYNDIYTALFYSTTWVYEEKLDGDYSGYYGEKFYISDKDKEGIVIKHKNGTEEKTGLFKFDSGKDVINCIIDNADKYEAEHPDEES